MVATRMKQRIDILEGRTLKMEEGMGRVESELTSIKDLLGQFLSKCEEGRQGETSGIQSKDNGKRGTEASGSKNDDNGVTNTGEHKIIEEKDIPRYRHLDMPIFFGDDPLGWIFRVERYFRINRIPEEDKIDAAAVCFEDRALNWFQWREIREPPTSWTELKRAIIMRFHSSQRGDTYEQLFALRQDQTVSEYREKFELLSATLVNPDEEMLIGAFKHGLRDEIRADLRVLNLQLLHEVMDMAQRLDERNALLDKTRDRNWQKGTSRWTGDVWAPSRYGSTKVLVASEPTKPATTISSVGSTARGPDSKGGFDSRSTNVPIFHRSPKPLPKRLTDTEIARKRELGLLQPFRLS